MVDDASVVFLDECGVLTDMVRLHGRSPHGTRALLGWETKHRPEQARKPLPSRPPQSHRPVPELKASQSQRD